MTQSPNEDLTKILETAEQEPDNPISIEECKKRIDEILGWDK